MFAWGGPGLAFLVVVTVSHVLIDQWKVSATRRAEARALADAHRRLQLHAGGDGPGSASVGVDARAAIHYILDQALHLLVTVIAWLIFLAAHPPEPAFVDAVDRLFDAWDRTAVHAVILTGVVAASLLIANTKAAFFLVATLVHPREIVGGTPEPEDPSPVVAVASTVVPPAPVGYTFRLGPVVATMEPTSGAPAIAAPAPPGRPAGRAPQPRTPPARIGATIGVLERLLIVGSCSRAPRPASGSSSRPRPSPASSSSTTGASPSTTCWDPGQRRRGAGDALLAAAALDTIR